MRPFARYGHTASQPWSEAVWQGHPLGGQSVVVDGPALVHRLWELVMVPESAESAALCHVTYATLGQSCINWLDRLRAGNVNV